MDDYGPELYAESDLILDIDEILNATTTSLPDDSIEDITTTMMPDNDVFKDNVKTKTKVYIIQHH